ncbi:MAG: VWA domain-containing protein [Methanoregula sp.]|nr:VWA domain-containing protein [Methanoregula sp.]
MNPQSGYYQVHGAWPSKDNYYKYFNSYSDATIDHDFVVHQAELSSMALQNTIAGYNGVGGTNYAAGINAALQLFAKNPNTHTKSIIIMGDGIPMMAPLAAGSLESYWPSDWYPRSTLGWEDESDTAIAAAVDAANRAKAQGITVYAAGYPLNNQVDTATLQQMASSSDTYYYSPDPNKLTEMMLAIQGKIQTDAGVNTTMSLDFNNASASYGNTMFDYVYNPPVSTTITWQNGTTTVIDQTAEWNANNHQLNFNIGTIKLGQTWQTSFQLKAKQQGILDVCGNNSQVVFNNGAEFQNVSGCTVTVVNDQNNAGVTPLKIDISDLHITTPNTTITDFVPLQWNITYPGNQTAIELIYYSTDNSQWKLDKTWVIPNGTRTETYNLDVRNLPAGTYYIEVQGTAPDAGSDIESLSTGFNVGTAQKAYIKLE